MNTPSFPNDDESPDWVGVNETGNEDDHSWVWVCRAMTVISLLGALAVYYWLATPACTPVGWSSSCLGWSVIWVILGIVGVYGLLGLTCSKTISALSDR